MDDDKLGGMEKVLTKTFFAIITSCLGTCIYILHLNLHRNFECAILDRDWVDCKERKAVNFTAKKGYKEKIIL